MEWNLGLIYETKALWEEDFNRIDSDIENLVNLKGTLNSAEGLIKYSKISKESDLRISKLFVYASMNHDLNQKDVENSTMFSRIYAKYNELISKCAFIDPEILQNDYEEVMKWCECSELKDEKFGYEKLFRLNKYIKDSKSEELMANYNAAISGYSKLYSQLAVVDNHSEKVVISTGEEFDINSSNYRYYLGKLQNQDDRRKIFEAVFKFYDAHKATLAGIYNGILQSELAGIKNRGYSSILESKLYRNNIDEKVFLSLVETAKENAEPLKEYLEIRKKYFGLDKIHTYDRFLSFAESNKEYTYEASKAMVLEACKELGDDFYKKACTVLEDGRVSVYNKDGKRTGAYSTSHFEKGPFILLNHTNSISDAFTIAHEAGHSIHTLYANEAQPYQTSHYVIFVAEIASTFNEQLFLDYMIKNSNDKKEKLVLLQQAIDGLIGTFYRQTLFADYEYQAHKLVEANTPINATVLSNIMKELYIKYYGIDLNDEPYKEMVWAYIPHLFNTPFYVYQYATSYSASLAIYDEVKNGKEGAFDRYISLLKAGGSDYPVNICKKAGVDLTSKEPFMAVVKRLKELVEELKKALNE